MPCCHGAIRCRRYFIVAMMIAFAIIMLFAFIALRFAAVAADAAMPGLLPFASAIADDVFDIYAAAR